MKTNKKLITIFLLILSIGSAGCNRFSALSEPVVSQISLIVEATELVLNGQLPINEGCTAELQQLPTDGGLILNQETGEFSYLFQDLDPRVKDQDQFSYREVCYGETSFVKVVIINTQNLN